MTPFPVGIIGCGLMGSACAVRLKAAGIAVTGYDIDPAKAAALGGPPTASIADIARGSRTVVLAVFNTEQVENAVDALLAARPADAPPR
jgi:3-hydroxyisobutyrate dehydrogenase-like beta-hydroxyacid dehydrogenase